MIRKASQYRRHSLRKAAYPLALAAVLLPAGTLTLSAQVMQAPGTYPRTDLRQPVPAAQQQPAQQSTVSTPSTSAQQPVAAANATAPSLLTQPSQPAKVNIASGKLSVEANNSSLTAILQQVSSSTGMTINGLNKDERVFGVYGPGDPRDVLSELLEGSGYNIVMFGKTSTGTPSEINLSPRGAAPTPAMNQPHPAAEPQDDDDSTPAPQQEENPQPPPQPAPTPQSNGNGTRTPQQMFQDLQQMRQQQQQQTTTTDSQPQ